MALDFVIFDGDEVKFLPTFKIASVQVRPGKMKASGKTTIKGRKVCVDGDEGEVEVSPCKYTTFKHSKEGIGSLKIKKLAAGQLTKKTYSGNKRIILKGIFFESLFEVKTPAEDITPVASGGPPIPDTTRYYTGIGQLVTDNNEIKAS